MSNYGKYWSLPLIDSQAIETAWLSGKTGSERKKAAYQFHVWLMNRKHRIQVKERQRIIAIIEAERDAWTKPVGFSYKAALTALIERIK